MTIENAGDAERLAFELGQYMISEIVSTGTEAIILDYNVYQAGNNVSVEYRHGATPNDCVDAAWESYIGSFVSLGYVQIRLTATA